MGERKHTEGMIEKRSASMMEIPTQTPGMRYRQPREKGVPGRSMVQYREALVKVRSTHQKDNANRYRVIKNKQLPES